MMMPENVFDFSTALENCHAHYAVATEGQSPSSCEVTWQVPADLPYLKGHFPDQPIVPGVAMIDASIVLIKQFTDQPDLRLKSVKQAKFMSPLTVGDNVTIQSRRAREGTWDVEWKSDDGQLLVRLSLLMV